MTNQGYNAYDFTLDSVGITPLTDGAETVEIAPLVLGFKYYEDITTGFVSANLMIVDSGINVRGNLPIQGYEEVNIKITDCNGDQHEYDFHVYRIGDVSIRDGLQSYNLGLITAEAIENERIKLNKTLKGSPHQIVESIISENFPDSTINTDVTNNRMVLSPGNKSPFSICHSLQPRSIPYQKQGDTGGTVGDDVKLATGSAGFLFYRNKDGFNFRALDTLCDPTKGGAGLEEDIVTLTDQVSDTGASEEYIITKVEFTSEINIMEGLRLGAYNTELQTFNIDTMEYEKSVYQYSTQYDKQSHLGSAGLTQAQEIMSTTPARISTAIVSNEPFYSDKDAAKDNSDTPDRLGFYIPQSFSRNYILNTQGLQIEIPSNLDLTVGNRVNVVLTNSIVQENREADDIDIHNSGFYLITKLSRFFDKSTNKAVTVLKLQRDSHGSDEDLNSTN
tara:strand:+ start:7921 stop:9264 length:1344 start_codon:yes stop_codon:yes gene_type:complete